MFSATASPFGRHSAHANAYRTMAAETGVAAASPHRLVAMLYEGFLDALTEARGALRSGDLERKGQAIGRAVRIVEEGLRAGLNREAGGQLAGDLDRLYTYVAKRLTQAHARNDEALLDECRRLLQPLAEAWAAIEPAATADRRAA